MPRVPSSLNVVALAGRLARPPSERVLPSGDRLVAYEVTVERAGEPAESVPVVWPGPPPAATDVDVGETVVVVGRVRRRFFRANGSTQSRTEVVAERVLAASSRAAPRLLASATRRLEAQP